ncbi:MAG: hypothetical protein R2911_15120 [Caldilineaceae bacterium]
MNIGGAPFGAGVSAASIMADAEQSAEASGADDPTNGDWDEATGIPDAGTVVGPRLYLPIVEVQP